MIEIIYKSTGINKKYYQFVTGRSRYKDLILHYLKIHEITAIKPPIKDPNVITLLGMGDFFEPLIDTGVLLCCCYAECFSFEEGHNLKKVAEFIRNKGFLQ